VAQTVHESTVGMRITIAESAADRQKIFQFRYTIYIEEMHRIQPYADAKRKVIEEPLDKDGVLIACFDADRLAGTLRINFIGKTTPIDRTLYNLESVEALASSRPIVFLSKLMICKQSRSSVVFKNLCNFAYEFGLRNDVAFAIMDCNDHLVQIFRRLGFVPYAGTVDHPWYGRVTPMLLDVENISRLLSVRSPFVSVLESYQKSSTNPQPHL
jgi:hypothetical protein